jgi:hypothetical protein
MCYKKNFDLVIKEINKRYRYIDNEHYLFDIMMYELRASTYFIYEDMKHNYTICNI